MNDLVDVCITMANVTPEYLIEHKLEGVISYAFELIIGGRHVTAQTLLSKYPLEFWFNRYYDLFLYSYFLYATGTPFQPPQQYARAFIKVELDTDYMKSIVVRNHEFLELSPYNSMFIKKDGSYASVCNYCDTGYTGLVDHFDFGQLYPHIYVQALTGYSKDMAQRLLELSMILKKYGRPEQQSMRPLIKLMLNSYWGLVSCSNTLFKEYMLSSERYMIHSCLPFCDGTRLIKTDGIFSNHIDVGPLECHLSSLGDFPIDYELQKPISIVNTGNYIYNGSYIGTRFRNGLTGFPYYGFQATSAKLKDGAWVERSRDSVADACYSRYKELLWSIEQKKGDEGCDS